MEIHRLGLSTDKYSKSVVCALTLILISLPFLSHATYDTLTEPVLTVDTTTVISDSSAAYFFPESDYDFIPGEANYDLIKDRLSCIENEVPLHYNTSVHAFVNYFAVKNRDYTREMIRRKNLYFPLFEKYLKKYGLPEELKYLSIVESGLNPNAVSSARAAGLWQFMSTTGRYYGLHQDWYIDERMDPEKSTEAAAKYLKQLYDMFHDWELAIAAYNTGPGNIRRAIRRSGYKKSFWEIYPYVYRETRAYLPQFIAVTYIMNYAQEHNFLVDDQQFSMETDTLHIPGYLHFETFANQVNLCLDDIKNLNPGLRHGVVPETRGGYPLRVPADVKEMVNLNRLAILDSAGKVGRKEIEYLAKNTIGSTYGREKISYKVRSGDVLGVIAQRYNVRTSDLRKWNNIHGNLIRVGQTLNIWLLPGAITKATPPPVITSDDGSRLYVVQPGDTLWDISRKFTGLKIEDLKKLNQLETNHIKPGQKLIVSVK